MEIFVGGHMELIAELKLKPKCVTLNFLLILCEKMKSVIIYLLLTTQ